jgi:hypothetical protein
MADVRPTPHRRLIGPSAAVAVLLAAGWGTALAAGRPSDYEVKAALTFNFLKFVEWPPDAPGHSGSTIEVCVYEEPLFARALRSMGDRPVGGKHVLVREASVADLAERCRVAFLGQSPPPAVMLDLATRSVLTLGESAELAGHGHVIGFYIENDRVHFEIDLAAARRARLKLSSKVLRLARLVNSTEPLP